MINIKELRVGSVVSFKGLSIGIISSVSNSTAIELENNDGVFDDECLRPVDLTPEILLQLGFEEYKEIPLGYWKELSHFKLGRLHLQFERGFTIKASLIRRTIKHLHQLQNICLWINEEDLTIPEKFTVVKPHHREPAPTT